MGIKEAVLLTLVLLYTSSISCKPVTFPDEPFNCNRYLDYVLHDWSCRPDGLFGDVFAENGNDSFTSGNVFQSEARARCSNESLIASYMNCMETLSVQCPQQFPDVADSLEQKLSRFCEGNDVSEWLRLVILHGKYVSLECSRVSDDVSMACVTELDIQSKINGANISFAMASEVIPPIISDVFHCMKRNMPQTVALSDECDSSWQNILLNYWSNMIFRGSLFVNLSYEDGEELLALVSDHGSEIFI